MRKRTLIALMVAVLAVVASVPAVAHGCVPTTDGCWGPGSPTGP